MKENELLISIAHIRNSTLDEAEKCRSAFMLVKTYLESCSSLNRQFAGQLRAIIKEFYESACAH